MYLFGRHSVFGVIFNKGRRFWNKSRITRFFTPFTFLFFRTVSNAVTRVTKKNEPQQIYTPVRKSFSLWAAGLHPLSEEGVQPPKCIPGSTSTSKSLVWRSGKRRPPLQKGVWGGGASTQVVVCAKVEGEEDFCLVCGQGACNARDGARTRCNHEAGGSRAGCTQDCGLKRGVVHEPVGNIYANLSRLWCVIGGGCDVHESAASWTAKQRHPLNYC